jgi:hypothetical protein
LKRQSDEIKSTILPIIRNPECDVRELVYSVKWRLAPAGHATANDETRGAIELAILIAETSALVISIWRGRGSGTRKREKIESTVPVRNSLSTASIHCNGNNISGLCVEIETYLENLMVCNVNWHVVRRKPATRTREK